MSDAHATEQSAPPLARAFAERIGETLLAAGRPVPLHAPQIDGNAWNYVKDCLDTGWVSSVGTWVDRFEAMLADATGARHAVATVNGTAALHAALLAAGVRPGDEVLVPAFTFVATANAVAYCGASAHFVDCEDEGFGIDPGALESRLRDIGRHENGQLVNRLSGAPIRVLVPVHCYGHPANMAALMPIAERFGIAVVEDAAESLGAGIDGRHTGRFGAMGTLSFNGNKTVTTGAGGAVITDNELLARRLRHMTTTARAGDGSELVHDAVGFNYRMANLNASLGCAQLESLAGMLEDKRALADLYRDALADLPGVRFVAAPPWGTSNHWLNAVVFADRETREAARAHLERGGVGCRPFWTPLHRMPMYVGNPRAPLPESERLGDCGLLLPSGAGTALAARRAASIDR